MGRHPTFDQRGDLPVGGNSAAAALGAHRDRHSRRIQAGRLLTDWDEEKRPIVTPREAAWLLEAEQAELGVASDVLGDEEERFGAGPITQGDQARDVDRAGAA